MQLILNLNGLSPFNIEKKSRILISLNKNPFKIIVTLKYQLPWVNMIMALALINHIYIDSGTPLISNAILDNGANSTCVNNKQLITNTSPPLSPVVQVADGSLHQIFASGNLHLWIRVLCVAIVKSDKMFFIDGNKVVDKMLDFVIEYSQSNN